MEYRKEEEKEKVVQAVEHAEPPEVITPTEAQRIVAEQESGYVERRMASASPEVEQPLRPCQGISEIRLLNFTRHPPEFERALREGDMLRECREALRREGYSFELPSGAKIFVQPEEPRGSAWGGNALSGGTPAKWMWQE